MFNFGKKKNNGNNLQPVQGIDSSIENLIEDLTDGIFRIDKSGKVLYSNNSFAKIFGYDSKDEIYAQDSIIKHFKSPENYDKLLQFLSKHTKVKNYRISMIKKDSSQIIVRINGRVNFNDKREPVTFEGSAQDITGIVRKEIETKNAIERLQREKLNAHEEVSQARKTSDFKSQFLANMSHEIRTPMNSVLGFLTLIENELYEDPDELKQFSANARGSAESLLDIINNILDLSKIEAGKMELEESEFNLKEEIQKVISMITPSAKEKALDVFLDINPEVPAIVVGDATRYRQILINLAGNAVKFTDEGEITIKIDLTEEAKIRSSVIDTGKGISEEDVQNLFKAYSQVKDTTKNKVGTGLGLMISKEFASLMGGNIDIQSQLGEGSTFSFTVDFKYSADGEKIKILQEKFESEEELTFPEDPVEAPPAKEPFPVANPQTANKKRILLVEDNPISQKVELRILREVGYSVDPVSNGLEAIEAVRTGSFHLVLMDVEMAEMNGLIATKKIRELEGDMKNIPIIAVTANSSMKDREKCLAAGMDDYIAKPININFLKMTIDRWLNDSR